MSAPIEVAQDAVIRAALRLVSSRMDAEARPVATSGDEIDYSAEMLAVAARDLTRATDALEPQQQPVGWSQKVSP